MLVTLVLAVSALIAGIDQAIKYFVVQDLMPVKEVKVIDGLFSLVYVENRGVALGMMQNHVWLFAVITVLLIAVLLFFIISKKFTGKLFIISTMLLIGGGIGNFADRVTKGFVVDYLSVSFFPPVCNFADYCITVGAVLLIISMIVADVSKKPSDKLKEKAAVNEDKDKD
ncbi:MAG: signal peptidase II [Clostridia bacterium]|nr:signal peptidase II [Clostridia bacterium]